jgi:hypothetical protein
MSGSARATFQCGALIYGGEGVRPDFPCDAFIVLPLINDGQYTNFTAPQDWHIELGTKPDGTDAVVRCPNHCRFVGESLAAGGHWEDFG